MGNHPAGIQRLRREWAATTLVYALGLGAAYGVLSVWWTTDLACLWLIPASAVAVLILVGLWRNLALNHRRAEIDLLPTMGVGTALTLSRGLLTAFMAGFLIVPRPPGQLSWLPMACYLAAALIDYSDGYVARVTGHATLLGEKLDLDLDAFGLLAASLLAVLYGQLPAVYLLVGAARYVFAAGVWRLKRQGKPVYNLTQSERRRGLAGFQMGLNVAALLPGIGPPGTSLTAILFMIPFLVGFLKDWLVVSGVLDPQSGTYQDAARWAEQTFYGWLPLLFRAGAGGLVIYFVLTSAAPLDSPAALSILILFQIGLALLIVAGLLGRLAALLSLVASGLIASGANLEPLGIAVVITMTLVMLFGTGYFSAWQPEESLLRYQAGATT